MQGLWKPDKRNWSIASRDSQTYTAPLVPSLLDPAGWHLEGLPSSQIIPNCWSPWYLHGARHITSLWLFCKIGVHTIMPKIIMQFSDEFDVLYWRGWTPWTGSRVPKPAAMHSSQGIWARMSLIENQKRQMGNRIGYEVRDLPIRPAGPVF